MALLATMTVGSLVLVAMETPPIRPEVPRLAALAPPVDKSAELVSATQTPLRRATWQNIVVHSSVEGDEIASQCHFIVHPSEGPDGQHVQATALWKQQQASRHLAGRLGDSSIGIFLVGRFDAQAPSSKQFDALVGLSRNLQRACAIGGSNIYLARELDPRCGSPGKAFPLRQFNSMLLQ